jgi:transposase
VCRQCGAATTTHDGEKHGLCPDCNHARRYTSSASAAQPALAASSPSPSLFGRPTGCIDQLTLVERAAIATLHGVGWTGRAIAQELRCSEQTVSLWVHRWQETRSLDDAERSGRPRCTTDDVDQDIGLYSWEHHKALPRDIVRELELPVSAHTVRRRRCEIDLHTYVRRREYAYTERDLRRRLSFAEGYSHMDWSRVLWSDHTLFTLDYDGREYVTRPPGHAFDREFLEPEPAERLQGAVWLWGCICADGLGHAELYEGTLDAKRYQRILSLNLVKSAHTFWPTGMWWFQQDNASPHTAGTSQAWFHTNGVTALDFPAYSSDLSPIENFWSDLKRRVYAHHPKTMEELEYWIGHEWRETKLELCKHLCLSMPQRLQLLIANKGHKISY